MVSIFPGMLRIESEITASKKSAALHAHSASDPRRMLSMNSSQRPLHARLPIQTVTEHFFVGGGVGVHPGIHHARLSPTYPCENVVSQPSDSAHSPYHD